VAIHQSPFPVFGPLSKGLTALTCLVNFKCITRRATELKLLYVYEIEAIKQLSDIRAIYEQLQEPTDMRELLGRAPIFATGNQQGIGGRRAGFFFSGEPSQERS